MKTLIILSAMPGSGKSTWAKKYQEEHSHTLIISSDQIRFELTGQTQIVGEAVGNIVVPAVTGADVEGLGSRDGRITAKDALQCEPGKGGADKHHKSDQQRQTG